MLNNNLKSLRINKGLTQKELAEESGITRESIGNYERGDRIPPTDIIVKIAAALGCSVNELLENDDILSLSDIPKSKRGVYEDFMFDDPNTFRLINFLESNNYEIKYEKSNKTIIIKNTEKIGSINEKEFTDLGNTLLKLLDYSKAVADDFVDNIIQEI